MGVWGTGTFDNDDALDFAGEIRTVDDLVEAVRLHDFGEAIAAAKAHRVLVVGECVAAMRGHPNPQLPHELAQRLEAFGEPSDDLFDDARDSVSLVISSSELTDLWAESNDRAGFGRAMTDLIDRLNQPVGERQSQPRQDIANNASPCWICGKEMGAEHTSISVTLNPEMGMSQSGSVHLSCLNAALHPRFLIQDWQFDDAMLDRFTSDIFGKDN